MLYVYTDANAYADARRQASEWEKSAKTTALGLEMSVLDMWEEVAKIARLAVCSHRDHPWETATGSSSTGGDECEDEERKKYDAYVEYDETGEYDSDEYWADLNKTASYDDF